MNIKTTVAFTGYRTAKILKSAPNNPHILREIAERLDQVIIIEPKMNTAAYFKRNDFLVDNATVIVCYYDGQKGGTRYTVERAYSQSKVIKNIAQL